MAKGQGKGPAAGSTPAGEPDPESLASGALEPRPPVADDAIGSADQGTVDFDRWAPPLHLRYHFHAIGGVIASVAWLWGIAHYIETSVGWTNLAELLPHEIGGLAAGAFTPLTLMWMVIALWERGQSLRRETEALRWHMRRMIYPSDKAQTRVREITEALQRQARDLTQASEEATKRGEATSNLI